MIKPSAPDFDELYSNLSKMQVDTNRWGQRYVEYDNKKIKINELVNVLFKEMKSTNDKDKIDKGMKVYTRIKDEFLDDTKVEKKGKWISFQHSIRSWFGKIGSGRSAKMNELEAIKEAHATPASAKGSPKTNTSPKPVPPTASPPKPVISQKDASPQPQPQPQPSVLPQHSPSPATLSPSPQEAQNPQAIPMSAAEEKYSKIMMNYEVNEQTGTLWSKADQIDTGLKPHILLTAIKKGMEVGAQAQKIKFEDNGTSYKFYASENLENFHFVQVKLGEGDFGRVFKTVELNNGKIRALKKTFLSIHKKGPHKDKIDERHIKSANESAELEYKLLIELNKNGPQEGIPSPPSKIFYITSEKAKNLGVEIELGFFDMDLKDYDLENTEVQKKINGLEPKQKLLCLRPLVFGVKYLHENGYVHKDLKPDNCFIKLDANGNPDSFQLGDFGTVEATNNESFLRSDFEEISKVILWTLLGGKGKTELDWYDWNDNRSDESLEEELEELKKLQIPEPLITVLQKGINFEGKDPDYKLSDFLTDYDAALKEIN